ncbi:OmpP1/FadL family transporter [Acidocella sp. KAb 2-4]|uniref:OmpP1/FadL family transporter n=1 Tax=Acidocella sp. KAb 2-4 TaxID=2885158 RepID=UPI001D060715|nr:OmpP1/FadL family transporter [Acidocella sp. KAb 2-4]MCB5945058.1 OmpP1/FadL family transporter [Acidocella sp. KAb 2-4]
MRIARLHINRLSQVSALALLSALGAAGPVFASGFGLREGSADWLGNAFAGAPAKAYDASTVWSNPAGMALLDNDELDAAVSYIGPYTSFSGTAAAPTTAPVPGVNGGNSIAPAATGATFGVFTLAPAWRLGFSVTAPFGERVAYPADFVGRYQSLVSNITDVNLGIALSYKVNDHLAIGFGPNFDYFSARLTQAEFTGVNALAGDPVGDVHGNSLGVGYNLGVLYQVDDTLRFGADYRSRIRHDIYGAERVSFPAAYGVPTMYTAATTTITLPDSLSIGVYKQLTPQLALLGSVEWTDWSLFNTLNITPRNGSATTIIRENWRNTWYVGVGANYQLTDKLMLQGGVAYDQSPVTDSNRTTRVPDGDHYDLGVGAQYQLLPNVRLELAYLHVFIPHGHINNSAGATAGTITGNYTDSDNSVTAGVNVRF